MKKTASFFKSVLCVMLLFGCVSVSNKPSNVKQMTASLEIKNATPYEITHIYAKAANSDIWSDDLLQDKSILPFGKTAIKLPGGYYQLYADIVAENEPYIVEDEFDFTSGKQYVWEITEDALISAFAGSYDYMDAYSYMDIYDGYDAYGYMDTYGYIDEGGY